MDKGPECLSPLAEDISEYTSGRSLPMHMPGHKRRTDMLPVPPAALDITEIHGFDNLHCAEGILLRAEERAARLWGSRRCFFLVGGSTCGILAAVRAATKPGDTVLVARNCHKSVYHAVELCALRPVYLFPEADPETGIIGSVTPEQASRALAEHPEAALLILTSPTYEGVVSDITGIAEAAHGFRVPVLADSAHGAHLGFSPEFPESAVRCGADIVVMSLHKTLPALTQAALAHVSGTLVDEKRLARELSVFETSSPSYVLMSSIDACVGLLEARGGRLFAAYAGALAGFYRRAEKLCRLKVLTGPAHPAFFSFDPGKLVVLTGGAGIGGARFAEILRERYAIEIEMAGAGYIVAMTSICDTAETLDRFTDALLEIDGEPGLSGPGPAPTACVRPEIRLPAYEAVFLDGERLGLSDAEGRTALEYLWAYPPGIPLVVPGEAVTADVLRAVEQMAGAGIAVVSSSGDAGAVRCAFEGQKAK
jgi:arginine/lysine/ornithine decarboxylase